MGRHLRLRSMSESEKQSDIKENVIKVASFMIATEIFGVCLQEVHTHGRELRPLHRHFELPIIFTIADTVSLFILLKFESVHGLKKHIEGLIVLFLCHIVQGYLCNFWYIYSRNDSFAVGYFEPVMLIILLNWCSREGVPVKAVLVLITMSVIAGWTSGELQILTNANRHGIIIFLVIFFICLRNIALKYLHSEGLVMRCRKKVTICYTFLVLAFGVAMSAFHLTFWALPVMFAILAMFASVTMFYMTSDLLESFSLVTVSVLGLISQICVNVICIPVEHGHNIVISFVGVILLALIVYIYMCVTSDESVEKFQSPVPNHEVYTRMEFLIFAGLVCGLIFYVFKPKISERDLNNLHYVGLDNVVKWFINHD
ncbi:hypothetical protein ACF0H5_023586 [Mactra antiquata]